MLKRRIPAIQGSEVSRNQPGLPVMTMQDVRRQGHRLTERKDGFTEIYKPMVIVGIIAIGVSVQVGPVIKRVLLAGERIVLYPTEKVLRGVSVKPED